MLVVKEQDRHTLRRAYSTDFTGYLRDQAASVALNSLGLEGPALHRQQGKAQVLIELAETLEKIRAM